MHATITRLKQLQYALRTFEWQLHMLHHIFQPVLFSHNQLSLLPEDIIEKNPNISTLEFKFSFKLLMSSKYSIFRKKMLHFLEI